MAEEHRPRHTREDLQLLAVREILRATSTALPLNEILSVIANMAIIVFEASTSWFMLLEDDELHTVLARGEFGDELAEAKCRIGSSESCGAAISDKPMIIQPQDISPSDTVIGVFAREQEPIVLLPLRSGDKTLGLLGAAVTPEASLDISFLVTIAQQASAAIENAQLRQESLTWRQRLDTVFERMVEPVLIFDQNGRLALMNDSAKEVVGHHGVREGDDIRQLVAKTGLVDPQGQPLAPERTAVARALGGERVENVEEQLPVATGPPRHFLVSAAPVAAYGRLAGAVVVWRDISYIRETERTRAEFLSMISHELRTPLTSAMGYAQLLQRDNLQDKPLKEVQKPLAAIIDQVKRVNALVEDLLDTSRAEVGRLALKVTEMDLKPLITKTIADSKALAPNHRFTVNIPARVPRVKADPGRVEQVLRNILSNAVKFSDPGTEVTVGVTVEKDRVIVSVSDQGPGIAKEDIPTLFMPFHRVHRPSGREVKGVGLGLFISRTIVEALGGQIWVRSQLNKGSVFSFSLPRA